MKNIHSKIKTTLFEKYFHLAKLKNIRYNLEKETSSKMKHTKINHQLACGYNA